MPAVTETTSDTSRVRPERVAPWPHTVVILLVLAMWAIYGALRAHAGFVSDVPRWIRYSGQMLLLWLMTGTAIAGLYHRRRFLRSILKTTRPAIEVALGAVVFLVGAVLLVAVGHVVDLLHLTRYRQAVTAIAPHTPTELVLWVLVSASAGVCEEFLFRGYLLRQLLDWSGSTVAAVFVTAALFGCMHLYEGTAAAIQIAALGALFAIVAVQRASLISVIVAHFLQDAVAGLFLFIRH